MQRSQLEAKATELYNAVVADRQNNGEKVDAKTMRPIAIGFEVGVAVVAALLSIADSQAVLARKARADMGWKPGDEATP